MTCNKADEIRLAARQLFAVQLRMIAMAVRQEPSTPADLVILEREYIEAVLQLELAKETP